MNPRARAEQQEVVPGALHGEEDSAWDDSSPVGEMEVMSPITKQAYTPEEVAKLLGLHPNSVYQMLKNGELPGIKAGRKWLISKRRFRIWLDGEDQ